MSLAKNPSQIVMYVFGGLSSTIFVALIVMILAGAISYSKRKHPNGISPDPSEMTSSQFKNQERTNFSRTPPPPPTRSAPGPVTGTAQPSQSAQWAAAPASQGALPERAPAPGAAPGAAAAGPATAAAPGVAPGAVPAAGAPTQPIAPVLQTLKQRAFEIETRARENYLAFTKDLDVLQSSELKNKNDKMIDAIIKELEQQKQPKHKPLIETLQRLNTKYPGKILDEIRIQLQRDISDSASQLLAAREFNTRLSSESDALILPKLTDEWIHLEANRHNMEREEASSSKVTSADNPIIQNEAIKKQIDNATNFYADIVIRNILLKNPVVFDTEARNLYRYVLSFITQSQDNNKPLYDTVAFLKKKSDDLALKTINLSDVFQQDSIPNPKLQFKSLFGIQIDPKEPTETAESSASQKTYTISIGDKIDKDVPEDKFIEKLRNIIAPLLFNRERIDEVHKKGRFGVFVYVKDANFIRQFEGDKLNYQRLYPDTLKSSQPVLYLNLNTVQRYWKEQKNLQKDKAHYYEIVKETGNDGTDFKGFKDRFIQKVVTAQWDALPQAQKTLDNLVKSIQALPLNFKVVVFEPPTPVASASAGMRGGFLMPTLDHDHTADPEGLGQLGGDRATRPLPPGLLTDWMTLGFLKGIRIAYYRYLLHRRPQGVGIEPQDIVLDFIVSMLALIILSNTSITLALLMTDVMVSCIALWGYTLYVQKHKQTPHAMNPDTQKSMTTVLLLLPYFLVAYLK